MSTKALAARLPPLASPTAAGCAGTSTCPPMAVAPVRLLVATWYRSWARILLAVLSKNTAMLPPLGLPSAATGPLTWVANWNGPPQVFEATK